MAYEDNDADMIGKTGSTSSPGDMGTNAGTVSSGAGRDYSTFDTTQTPSNQYPGESKPMMDQAQDKISQVKDQAQQKTAQAMDQAQQQAKSMLHEQKGRAADRLETVADALRQTGQHMKDQNEQGVGQYAERAADAVEQFSDRLRNKNVDELVYEAQDFARREPQWFLGGAVVAGIFLARFFKSSGSSSSRQGYYRGGAPMHPRPRTYDYGSSYTTEEYYQQTPPPAMPPRDLG